jgi:hypothetical protein
MVVFVQKTVSDIWGLLRFERTPAFGKGYFHCDQSAGCPATLAGFILVKETECVPRK